MGDMLMVCLLVAGGFVVSFGLALNWARGSQSTAHQWVKARAPIILTILVVTSALMRLWRIYKIE